MLCPHCNVNGITSWAKYWSVPHKQPLGNSYFLTVVDPNNDGKKLIIDPNSRYGFRWVRKKSRNPAQRAVSANIRNNCSLTRFYETPFLQHK